MGEHKKTEGRKRIRTDTDTAAETDKETDKKKTEAQGGTKTIC